MLYPTHSVGMVVPVTGERLVEVQAIGWGDKHEILQTNEYNNPFWNTTGFFKTSGGHASRISVCWHIADKETERGSFYGDRMSYIVERPEGSPDTIMRIEKEGKTTINSDGYPEGTVVVKPFKEPTYWDRLPPSMRVPTGHGGSHVFLAHEFIRSIKGRSLAERECLGSDRLHLARNYCPPVCPARRRISENQGLRTRSSLAFDNSEYLEQRDPG